MRLHLDGGLEAGDQLQDLVVLCLRGRDPPLQLQELVCCGGLDVLGCSTVQEQVSTPANLQP